MQLLCRQKGCQISWYPWSKSRVFASSETSLLAINAIATPLIVAAMTSYSWSVAWDASPSNAWPDRRARAWALACTNGSYGTFKIPMWISLVHKSILNHLSLEVGRVLRNFKTHVLFTFLAEMMSWNFSPGLMSQREAKNICKIICREQDVILTDFCMKDYASIGHWNLFKKEAALGKGVREWSYHVTIGF